MFNVNVLYNLSVTTYCGNNWIKVYACLTAIYMITALTCTFHLPVSLGEIITFSLVQIPLMAAAFFVDFVLRS
jgi:hypothetical protein